ncbi:hypothetical protein V0U79_11910 [Hyphobacterium sp. HN65]|uniref:Uncharacterized protein n=1 Tax=Hyphobacterium lacteum TaxID=3116575 RepID=A0ABU7LT24_9PROT|nr:hypothetical protein [Hyphobacterium sp. HN65]MEE2527075.1 hypothetical protein [Hyphobacterium sp. HN65]
MTRFEELADAWGGDIRRWPEAVREEAYDFAAANADAAEILASAAVLDGLLSSADEIQAGDLLQRRILQSAPLPVFETDWRRPAIAAAAALVLGVAGGFAGGLFVPAETGDVYESEYADAFDGLMEDWSAWEWSDA